MCCIPSPLAAAATARTANRLIDRFLNNTSGLDEADESRSTALQRTNSTSLFQSRHLCSGFDLVSCRWTVTAPFAIKEVPAIAHRLLRHVSGAVRVQYAMHGVRRLATAEFSSLDINFSSATVNLASRLLREDQSIFSHPCSSAFIRFFSALFDGGQKRALLRMKQTLFSKRSSIEAIFNWPERWTKEKDYRLCSILPTALPRV